MAGGTAEEEKSDCSAKADGRRVAAGNPSVGAWKRAEWELQCGSHSDGALKGAEAAPTTACEQERGRPWQEVPPRRRRAIAARRRTGGGWQPETLAWALGRGQNGNYSAVLCGCARARGQ
ncbi:hypothetical protein TRIUR3_27244 [Triticum urartu]|uniref:Uncharacterized protein n=1 Tax=Triticum urartu TaxID=4572 RepID=M7YLD1_TRIUA|nr:hypothetical protein TRIUR3_27244 [Triticum urartu]